MNSKERDVKIKNRGRAGEKYVCDYLVNKGYTIIRTNYSSRWGEIDIIAEKDGMIAFVEVKTRKENSFASGLESITRTKLKRFVKTALDYLTKHGTNKQPRIDCVEVRVRDSDGSVVDIEYIENAVDDWSEYI